MQIKREHQINFWYVVTALMAVFMFQDFIGQFGHSREISYSDFQKLVSEHKVADLVIGPTEISGAFTEPSQDGVKHFSTVRVPDGIAEKLQTAGIPFSGKPAPGLLQSFLSWLLPTFGFVALWMFMIRPMSMGGQAGGLLSIGKSRAKVYVENDTKVAFSDVAGVDEAKTELMEIVQFLRDPVSYGRLGAHVPKGVLLVGPPGTGKTLLARAVAGEAGVRFFSISGSEFVEMFVGVGAARVRDLFEQARQQAPAIIFIDELDALGRARGGVFLGGGHDEKEQTLNQLLTEMDGFDPSSGIVLLAATNRPEVLDSALLRAGRFDRQVLVDRPDKQGRIDILRVHTKRIQLADSVSLENIAALTPGFTGADLANLVNEAALLATRRSAEAVILEDFIQAVERIVAGLEKRNKLLNPHERTVVAHHEMGHAILAMALPGTDPVQKVSIIPRGVAALGYTIQRPTEDRFLIDRSELVNRMTVLLGGRAAERLMFGDVSTGAADDLAKATEIARSMVTRFGMDPDLGEVSYESDRPTFLNPGQQMGLESRQYAEATAAAIDEAVRRLIEQVSKRADAILLRNRATLDRAAQLLLNRETLQDPDLEQIAAGIVRETTPKQPAA